MKRTVCVVVLVVIVLLFVPEVISARHIRRPRSRRGHAHTTQQPRTKDVLVAKSNLYWEKMGMVKKKGADTLQIAGSSLPDCSHACGSCTPCRLVMVSFVCASIEEAETCPMAYKCMCNHKSYPVP